MKRFNITDENAFESSDAFCDMPEEWDASLEYGGNGYYITCDDAAEEPLGELLKSENVGHEKMDVSEREYDGHNVTIAESSQYYYIDFNTGLGDGIYPKEDWTLEDALDDQANIYKEN